MSVKFLNFVSECGILCVILGGVSGIIIFLGFDFIYNINLLAVAEPAMLAIIAVLILILLFVPKCRRCEILIGLILAISAIIGLNICEDKSYILLIALLGITALIIPLTLSISSNYNIGSRLDSGEIRKSIVVSLTIIYIIFLVMSFDQTLHEQTPATNGAYLLNLTYDENAIDKAHKNIIININSASEGVLQVIPVTATANVANGTVQITPHVSNKTGAGDGGAGTIPLTSDNGTSLPTDAINSFTKNFLWVYALIISFYFGGRILEDRTDRNNIKDYIQKLITDDANPIDIATKRYVLGDIGSREFKTMKCDLEGRLEVRIRRARVEDNGKLIILNVWNGTCRDIEVEKIEIKVINDDKKIEATLPKKYVIKWMDHSLITAKIEKKEDSDKISDPKNIDKICIEAKSKGGGQREEKEKFSDQTTNIDIE